MRLFFGSAFQSLGVELVSMGCLPGNVDWQSWSYSARIALFVSTLLTLPKQIPPREASLGERRRLMEILPFGLP